MLLRCLALLELSRPLRIYFWLHHVHLAVDNDGVGPPLVAEGDLPDWHKIGVHHILLQGVVRLRADARDLRRHERNRLFNLRLHLVTSVMEAADMPIPAVLLAL